MERKTAGLIATILTSLLCGLPGLFCLCLGAMFAAISRVPGAEINMFGRNDPRAAWNLGLGIVGLSLVMIVIPFVVGLATLRGRDETPSTPVPRPPDEPLPPAV
jgi:hypothetical protein